MAKREKSKGRVFLWFFLFILIVVIFALLFIWLNLVYPGWKEKLKAPFIKQEIAQQTIINKTIEIIFTFKWIGIALIVMSVMAAIVFLFYMITKRKGIFFKFTPEQCQVIGFEKLTNNRNYNIRFENEKGTWFPPLCWNLRDDIRSSRVTAWYSVNRVSENESEELNKEKLWLFDCSQADPKNKFLIFRSVSRLEWVKFLNFLSQKYARFDAFKLDVMLPFEAEEYFAKGRQEGVKELGKQTIVGND